MVFDSMGPVQAAILGVVEGLTEFLPISSTGHLILAGHLLGVEGDAAKTFEIVIQAGALVAVVGLYGARVRSMARGLLGQEAAGRALLTKLLMSFLPAALAGLVFHSIIKARLFSVWPVVAALAVGGVVMIALDPWLRRRHPRRTIESLRLGDALLIGLAQCLSLWPGTSRAMVTILAGLLLGLSATAAAEYSFLLALPTLGAATLFDAVKNGGGLVTHADWAAILIGFITAALVAALAIKGLIQYLTRHGLAIFGWYRVGLAILVGWMVGW